MGLDIYFKARKKNFDRKDELQKVRDEISALDKEFEEKLSEVSKVYEGELLKGTENIIKEDYFQRCRPLDKIETELLNELEREIGYFRKVNFLIPYFDYEDDCSDKVISKGEIEALIDDCKRVLAERDREDREDVVRDILPTQCGFFFGSTAYDDYYFNDVEDVLDTFTKILDDVDFDTEDVIMYCWW